MRRNGRKWGRRGRKYIRASVSVKEDWEKKVCKGIRLSHNAPLTQLNSQVRHFFNFFPFTGGGWIESTQLFICHSHRDKHWDLRALWIDSKATKKVQTALLSPQSCQMPSPCALWNLLESSKSYLHIAARLLTLEIIVPLTSDKIDFIKFVWNW